MSREIPIDGLTHIPVCVAGSWTAKTVTTDAPKYTRHTEYALAWTFQCSIPLLPVIMLMYGDQGQFVRPWRSSAMHCLPCRMSFFPGDWKTSDQVWINFECLQIVVRDSALKQDPRPLVATDYLRSTGTVKTGHVITLASVAGNTPVEARLLLVAKSDTAARRGRWSLKPAAITNLPEQLRFLARGQTAGIF
ncbi:MAG: hypothetical protein ACHRHE_02860 [Tepidisphaerales bacterium]